jgi:hypothetical protein
MKSGRDNRLGRNRSTARPLFAAQSGFAIDKAKKVQMKRQIIPLACLALCFAGLAFQTPSIAQTPDRTAAAGPPRPVPRGTADRQSPDGKKDNNPGFPDGAHPLPARDEHRSTSQRWWNGLHAVESVWRFLPGGKS